MVGARQPYSYSGTKNETVTATMVLNLELLRRLRQRAYSKYFLLVLYKRLVLNAYWFSSYTTLLMSDKRWNTAYCARFCDRYNTGTIVSRQNVNSGDILRYELSKVETINLFIYIVARPCYCYSCSTTLGETLV